MIDRVHLRLATVLVAGAFLLSCAGARRALPLAEPAELGLSETALDRIAPVMQAYVDSGKLAGIIAVIARHGRTGYEETFGWSDIERRERMKRDAVFRIFSMTKPVVAAGALKLVDQGKLSLDDPVAKYIPAFADIKVFAGGTADQPALRAPDSVMTVRHLLTHTAGLAYGLTRSPVDTIFRRASMYNAARTVEQFTDSLAKLPLMFSPGTSWSYSSGIDVVGRVIEVASGQALDRFLDEQIFRPLGMRATSFRKRADIDERVATLYDRAPDGRLDHVTDGLQAMFEPQARFLWGSGGLLSTIDDFLRFSQMLLQGGELNGVRVLSRESVAELMRDQLPSSLTPLNRAPLI
ncbi:MAG TPA: serine hydrolase domain-containing protein, partial [Longimicrobiales bacterium]|nr:serine hydrolase domain-containing protein [Longimicrobiales bacterium]